MRVITGRICFIHSWRILHIRLRDSLQVGGEPGEKVNLLRRRPVFHDLKDHFNYLYYLKINNSESH